MERAPDKPKAERWSKEEVKKTVKALVGAFLVLLPTAVESADFRNKSWLGGFAQMKHLALKDGQPEYKGLAIGLSGTENFKWVNLHKGEQDHIDFDTREGQITMLQDNIDYLKAQLKLKPLTACIAHTHPNSEGYFMGPSDGDINFHINYEKKVLDDAEVPVEVYGLIFGQIGAWYYDVPSDGIDQFDNNLGDTGLTLDDFRLRLNQVSYDPDATDDEIWEAIHDLEAAFAYNGVKARYVRYEDMGYEPACAGPYFDPGTMTIEKNF